MFDKESPWGVTLQEASSPRDEVSEDFGLAELFCSAGRHGGSSNLEESGPKAEPVPSDEEGERHPNCPQLAGPRYTRSMGPAPDYPNVQERVLEYKRWKPRGPPR